MILKGLILFSVIVFFNIIYLILKSFCFYLLEYKGCYYFYDLFEFKMITGVNWVA